MGRERSHRDTVWMMKQKCTFSKIPGMYQANLGAKSVLNPRGRTSILVLHVFPFLLRVFFAYM